MIRKFLEYVHKQLSFYLYGVHCVGELSDDGDVITFEWDLKSKGMDISND